MPDNPSRSEREVGRVVSVSTYRVKVLLAGDVRSSVRAYPRHVSLVSQIGGYVLFPVAPGETVVGVVIGAYEDEAIEPESDSGATLTFGRARKTVHVNLLGQIAAGRFLAGISVYPTLDTPALLPTEEELDRILRFSEADRDQGKDTSLAIGTSPLYARERVTVSYNDLLGRSLGVLGNTGSGKSYSVASIIQEALATGEPPAAHAKVIILDLNGEYGGAFPASTSTTERKLNEAYVQGRPFILPLWALNFFEFEHFFEAADRSQRPVLERVITSLREAAVDEGPAAAFRQCVVAVDGCVEILESLTAGFGNPTASYCGDKCLQLATHADDRFGELLRSLDASSPHQVTVKESQAQLRAIKGLGITPHHIPPEAVREIAKGIDATRNLLDSIRGEAITKGKLVPVTADSPVPFDALHLLREDVFQGIVGRFRGQERLNEYLSTLRLRIHRQIADRRWAVFTKRTSTNLTELLLRITDNAARVVVVDCSMLAHDVLPFFCAVFSRLILDLRESAQPTDRCVQPYVLVLEEAHNYVRPRREDEAFGLQLSREAFERIAKEGRKFGLSLVIASQRPADVSSTVLSQCANFLVHRIQNPDDIEYFKRILPTGSRELLDQLPILAPGEGLLLGSAVNVPVRVRVRKPHPTPDSETPKPWLAWQATAEQFPVEEAARTLLPNESAKATAEASVIEAAVPAAGNVPAPAEKRLGD